MEQPRLIKELKGHSGSKVFLMERDGVFVRKIGNVTRNLERFEALSKTNLNMPRIIDADGDFYDMEYIPNLDMRTYLISGDIAQLAEYICSVIDVLKRDAVQKDYTSTYAEKLNLFDFQKFDMPFRKDELISALPKVLPASEYHGDFTLENILFDYKTNDFVLIDPLTSVYDSFVFDLAKLRQDLVCKWFIRHDNIYFDTRLRTIADILNRYEEFSNDTLLILMLMRVLPYANEQDRTFLEKEIRKLWK